MYYIRRAMIWLWRWRHCRGFGVQSPSDYRFVRYVINEHWPYYAYVDLQRKYPAMAKDKRRLCELLFRLANDVQPDVCLNLLSADEEFADYVAAGCNKTRVMVPTGADSMPDGAADLMLCQTTDVERSGADRILSCLHQGSVLLVKGIRSSRRSKRIWQSLLSDDRVTVTFDLYEAGIIIIDNKRYKHNYIINF